MAKTLEERWSRINSDYEYITSKKEKLFYGNYIHGNEKIFTNIVLNDDRVKTIKSQTEIFKEEILSLVKDHLKFLNGVENSFLENVNMNLSGEKDKPFRNIKQYARKFEKDFKKAIKKDDVTSAIIRLKKTRFKFERRTRKKDIKDLTNHLYGWDFSQAERSEIMSKIGVKFRKYINRKSKEFDRDVIETFKYIMQWYDKGMFEGDNEKINYSGRAGLVQKLVGPSMGSRNTGFLKVDRIKFLEFEDPQDGIQFLIKKFSGYKPSRKQQIFSTIIGNEPFSQWGDRHEDVILSLLEKGGVLEKYMPILTQKIEKEKSTSTKKMKKNQPTVSDIITVEFDLDMEEGPPVNRAGISVKLRIHDIIDSEYNYEHDALSLVLKNDKDLDFFNYLKANHSALFGLSDNPWLQLEEELALLSMIPRFLDQNIKQFEETNRTGVGTILIVAKDRVFLVSSVLERILKKLDRGYSFNKERKTIDGIPGFKARAKIKDNKVPSSKGLWWEKIKIMIEYEGWGSLYQQFLNSSELIKKLDEMNKILRATSVAKVRYMIDLTKK